MSFDEIFDKAQEFYNNQKYQEAMEQYLLIEGQILEYDNIFNEFYCRLGDCAIQSKQYQLGYEYLQKMDGEKEFDGNWQAAQWIQFKALIYDHQFDKCLKVSQKLIDETDDNEILQTTYFYRGYCFQEQGLYLAAVKEYKKAIEYGCTQNTNLSYCLVRIGKYQEAKDYIEQEDDKDEQIQHYLVKSEIYSNLGQEKLGIEYLYTAHQYFISKSYDENIYSPEELEFLTQRLGPNNAQNIQRLYNYTCNNKNCDDKQNKVLNEFVQQINNKQQQNISPDLQNQIEQLFPKSFLSQMGAEKEIEAICQDPQIKDYYDSFLKEAEGVFYSAQGIAQGFQKVQAEGALVMMGAEIMKMIPLIGAQASSVLVSLNNALNQLQLEARSKALLDIGNTNQEFQNKLKHQLSVAFKNQSYQTSIKNPMQLQEFQNYLETIKKIQSQIKNAITVQAFGIFNEEQNQQQELGKKDAQELIGAYYSSGYLKQFLSENEMNSQCARYLISNETERKKLNHFAELSLKDRQAAQTRDTNCCNIQ